MQNNAGKNNLPNNNNNEQNNNDNNNMTNKIIMLRDEIFYIRNEINIGF